MDPDEFFTEWDAGWRIDNLRPLPTPLTHAEPAS